jgi:hypothetical protein
MHLILLDLADFQDDVRTAEKIKLRMGIKMKKKRKDPSGQKRWW